MKEKVIKKLNIELNDSEQIVELKESLDFLVVLDYSHEIITLNKVLRFIFTNQDINSDLKLRVVLRNASQITLDVIVHAPLGAKNITSTLDMKALVLNPDARIKFVPSLEIDEREVSLDHKSTIGVPDEQLINYMKSRGLSYDLAVEQLVKSFINM